MEQEKNGSTSGGANPRGKRIAVIAGVVAVVLLAGGLTWWGVATHNTKAQLAAAQETCQQAASDYATAKKTYEGTLKDKTVTAALKITAKQVKDAKTVSALAQESKASTPKTVACPTSPANKSEVEDATNAIKDAAGWYETHAKALTDGAKKVQSSKDAKDLDTAKASLNKRIDAGTTLYDSSKDKVQDSKTRDSLKKALDTANKVKDGKDIKKINDAATALQKAIDNVNKSVKAKQDADAKAKAEAEAAAQAQAAQEAANAQAQAEAQAQSQQSYTPTYSAPQQQYTAPQQNTTPQQSTPQSNSGNSNNGGGSSAKGPISGGHGVGSASDCDAACKAPIKR